MSEKKNRYFIGTAGWSYPDWNSLVYPPKRPRGFSELKYFSRLVNVVEVNSSFYKIPSAETVESWQESVKRESPFRFIVKLWQNFSHSFPYYDSENTTRFIDVLSVFDKELLAALLVQFPYRFKYSPETMSYLDYLIDLFGSFPMCIEFRHRSWNNQVVLSLFKQKNITFVNIDQPVISHSIGPTIHLTSKSCYIRFHGRNKAEWFKESGSRDSRYNYLYGDKELREWQERIRKVADEAEDLYLIFNNHFRAQAVINAFQMKYLLQGVKSPCPPELLAAAPLLQKFTLPDTEGRTLSLF